MFCGTCGNQIPDDAKFCATCGTATAAQAAQPPPYQQPYQQPYGPPQQHYGQQPYPQQPYQQPYYQAPPPPLVPDVPSTGLNVLSFFFWIAGVIIYATSNQTTPVKAKAALKWSLIGLVFWVVFGVLLGVLLPLLLMRSVNAFGPM